MLEKYLDKKFFTLFLLPFIIGGITVFSFQPFNLTFVNFIVLPIFFYLIIYIKKNQKVNLERDPSGEIFLSLGYLLDSVFT